jgi:hypothetical protein
MKIAWNIPDAKIYHQSCFITFNHPTIVQYHDDTVGTKRGFADISKQQLETIVQDKDAKNTRRSTDQSVRLFRKYLQEKELDPAFESYALLIIPQSCNITKNGIVRNTLFLYKCNNIRYGVFEQVVCDMEFLDM